MEILRFSEPPKRRSGGSRNKKSGFAPAASVVIAVAVMFGMSTTLAGTITLNTTNTVEFGQGVVTAAACDTSIEIVPATTYETSSSVFKITSLTISKIGTKVGTTASNGAGCLGKTFTVKAYNASGGILAVSDTSSAPTSFYIKIPSDTATAASNGFSDRSDFITTTVPAGALWSSDPRTDDSGVAGSVQINGLKIDSAATRFTIESS